MTEPDVITPTLFFAGYITGAVLTCAIIWLTRADQPMQKQPGERP